MVSVANLVNVNGRGFVTEHQVNVKELLTLWGNGEVVPYPGNRSKYGRSMVFEPKHVKNIIRSFTPCALGRITAVRTEAGTLMLADGHNRMEALRQLSENLPNFTVTLAVGDVTDHQILYTSLNNQIAHTTQQKLKNVDSPMGKLRQRLDDKVGSSTSKFSLAVADIINLVNASPESREYKFEDLRLARHLSNQVADGIVAAPDLDIQTEQRIMLALQFYTYVAAELGAKGLTDKSVRPLLGAVGIFSFLVIDHLNNGALSKLTPSTIAKKWSKNIAVVHHHAKTLARRGSGVDKLDVAKAYEDLLRDVK